MRAAFASAASSLMDAVALLDPREPTTRTLAVDASDAAVFRQALAEGRGVVFVSAHLGPWERLAAVLSSAGFPSATVARESYDPRFTELYERIRAPRGVRSIYRGRPGAATAVVRALRRGGAVGFLIDLPSRVPSVPLRLFGAVTRVPIGPARIALRTGAAVLVGTASSRTERIAIERVDTSDVGPIELTRRVVSVLEGRIAADPSAWLGLFGETETGSALPASNESR